MRSAEEARVTSKQKRLLVRALELVEDLARELGEHGTACRIGDARALLQAGWRMEEGGGSSE